MGVWECRVWVGQSNDAVVAHSTARLTCDGSNDAAVTAPGGAKVGAAGGGAAGAVLRTPPISTSCGWVSGVSGCGQ